MEFIEANWLLIGLVIAIAIAIGWYVFHAARRTRVTGERRDVLDEGSAPAARNQALIDAPATAMPEVPAPRVAPTGLAGAGVAVEAAVSHRPTPPVGTSTGHDDLTRIKGVGPKLAAQLGELGVTSLEQIAGWSEADIDRIDARLGRFQGRIRRDSWVSQASLLATGNDAGFTEKFGNIS